LPARSKTGQAAKPYISPTTRQEILGFVEKGRIGGEILVAKEQSLEQYLMFFW